MEQPPSPPPIQLGLKMVGGMDEKAIALTVSVPVQARQGEQRTCYTNLYLGHGYWKIWFPNWRCAPMGCTANFSKFECILTSSRYLLTSRWAQFAPLKLKNSRCTTSNENPIIISRTSITSRRRDVIYIYHCWWVQLPLLDLPTPSILQNEFSYLS